MSVGEAPSGSILSARPDMPSARGEPDFEALEAELGKMNSLAEESVEWPLVCQLAHGILSGQSNDLLVAAYYSVGLLRTRSYPGFASGLSVLVDLVEKLLGGGHSADQARQGQGQCLGMAGRTGGYCHQYKPSRRC